MKETKICLEKFSENFEKILGGKIAICGKSHLINTILQQNPKFGIRYVVDDNLKGRYIQDCYVVGFEEFSALDIDYLIIADGMQNSVKLFRDIRKECKSRNICIYNLYGKNMEECYTQSIEMNRQYLNLEAGDLKHAIDKNDVIIFDISDTLFALRYMYFSDFYRNIGKKINELGINIFDFVQSVANIKTRDSYSNLRVIIEVLIQEQCLPEEYLEKIWSVIIAEAKKAFVPRKAVVEALKYARENGKKVCLIEDMQEYRLPEPVWKNLLEEYGIGECDDIVCSGKYWLHKEEGLFEKIIAKYGRDVSYLHIGDEIEQDMFLGMYYGMNTFLVKTPWELFISFGTFVLEQLENGIVRDLFEKYLIKVYCDSYLVSEVKEIQNQQKPMEMASVLQEKIEFWKNCNSLLSNEPITYEPVLFDDIEGDNEIESYERLVFTEYNKPKVSIIIPVYNQFNYTYNCLKSVLKHSGEVPYEVIVADDCSTDHVKDIEKIVSGITVVHNKENLKFLLNCNRAAEFARGEYILFLNNDTQVQPDWLDSLTSLIDNDESIGMVGSKLVYPNGQLQEAGGILWKDGSAWNYGHLRNPATPEYCYVKEADYISGAAIMIRASLWKEIGGFDERFAPAYYEDTDLAFEVRKRGFKVCLQPKSIVVHFEGISNGTDLSTGLKNYQMVNHKKFFEKWRDVLEKEHFDNGENVYLAKDRGQTKKQILVVDHYVPNFDKDAGGRCTYMYIKMFLKLGMKVTFIGDNFAKPEPYTTNLNQMGVEVLYGDYYYQHWQEWLKDNLKYFDYIYLQRPHISIKYMDLVKEYGRGKIFYFAHDLHHVRMYRDYLVSGNEESLKESEHWKEIEMELFEKTDVGHVVGSYEQEIMQKAFPDKPIRNIPLYIYDDEPEGIEKDFSKRKDILFVGGFTHTPNIDAVLWFGKEIFPKILEKYPDMVWHIVGSNAPAEVKALANEHIVLEGFVTDEELGELYRKCRLVVVPLRYGAGVKGKIVESAYYQIPVVTTAIGGEGLDAAVGSFVMEDDAEKMAALVENLYTDYEELRKMSDAGETMIQKYFTSKAAEQVLLADMDI